MSFVCNTNPAHNSGHGGVGIPVWSHCWFFCTHFPGCRVSKRAVLMFVKESLSWLIKWRNWLASHGGMESVDVTVSDQLRLLRTTVLVGIRCCHLIENVCLCVAGLIHVGDELKEVNGIPVDDKKPEEIIRILVSLVFLWTFVRLRVFQLHSLGTSLCL